MQISCDLCSKVIEQNEPHHTINLHRERLNGNTITVDHAETLLTTCIECSSFINRKAIINTLTDLNEEEIKILKDLFNPMKMNV